MATAVYYYNKRAASGGVGLLIIGIFFFAFSWIWAYDSVFWTLQIISYALAVIALLALISSRRKNHTVIVTDHVHSHHHHISYEPQPQSHQYYPESFVPVTVPQPNTAGYSGNPYPPPATGYNNIYPPPPSGYND